MKRFLILTIGLVFIHLSAIAQLTEQQQIQKLNYVYQQIRNNYVDDVPLEPLVEEAIIATLHELDPHSKYLTREQMEAMQQRISGEFAGIGIRYLIHNDTMVVRNTMANSPAQRANILPNDRITSINGQSIIGLSPDSIATLLKGKLGTEITQQIIRRGTDKPLTIKLKRNNIESSAISAAYRIDNVGYIAVSAFSRTADSEFLAAYRKLGKIESLIIDLRDNGGGAITSAIDLTGLFLRKGDVIVSTEGRSNTITYDKKRDGYITDTPIVVIINENSASASELFAGAIQDHDRGVIIGHTSYGKGLVQKVIDLKDGSAITLTVARYKTPSGRIIQRPYSMGEGEKYERDTMRYMHPDSIPHDSKLLYTTLKRGRKVYGGGGITPDIYIDTDSVKLSQTLIKAHYSKPIFEHTAVDIWDCTSYEELLKQYPTVEEFNNNYMLSSNIMELFYRNSELSAEDLTPHDKELITTKILALMAERLYGDSARYYIYNMRYDIMTRRALEIATDNTLYEQILNSACK